MRKLIAVIAMMFVLSIASTALAGPFADVPAKHWAYNAISQLAKAGIVEGYGDSTFRGDKVITRYEMAIIVGKAMEHSDKADKANKVLIDKLSAEFATELKALGVRVSTLEEKVNNLEKIKVTGDFYFRYLGEKDSVDGMNDEGNYMRSRARINVEDKVNDRITANIRFTVRNLFGAGNSSRIGWETDTDSKYNEFDQYNIKYTTDSFTYMVGRQSINLGQGLLLSTGSDAQWPNQFDGIVASRKVGAVDTNIIAGTTTSSNALSLYGDTSARWYGIDMKSRVSKKMTLGAAYAHHDYEQWSNPLDLPKTWNNWAVNSSYTFTPKFTLNAEYGQSSNATNNRAYFIAGNYTMGKKDGAILTYMDTQRLAVDPYNSIYGSIIPLNWGTGINVDPTTFTPLSRDFKAWQLYYYHTVNKNTYIDLYLIDAKSPGRSGHDFEWFTGWNVNF